MSLLGEIKEFKWDFFTQSRLDVIVNVHQKWDLFQFSWLGSKVQLNAWQPPTSRRAASLTQLSICLCSSLFYCLNQEE